MKRHTLEPRKEFEKRNAEMGFDFGKYVNIDYWNEDVGYELTSAEVDHLEQATNELFWMVMETVPNCLDDEKYLDKLQISQPFRQFMRNSWNNPNLEYSLYGRFDFFFDGSEIKLYEYNGDTPTSLLESSLVQYHWMKDRDLPDQFNSIHEKLIAAWKFINEKETLSSKIHFAGTKQSQEDYRTVEYMMDTAHQAGCVTQFITVEDIGAGSDGQFYDLQQHRIKALFKLYPWEWLVDEEFAETLLTSNTAYFEPPWKMLVSNKAFLVKLWEKYPGHELLLPTYFDRMNRGDFVQKPLWGREGAGVVLPGDKQDTAETCIYQAYKPLPNMGSFHPMVGSWVIGDEAAGIGIREDKGLVTGNLSRFTPHWFV